MTSSPRTGPSVIALLIGVVSIFALTTGTRAQGWTPTGDLNVSRALHTATLLRDGRVLVAGGVAGCCSGSALDSAEVWDPATGTWSMTGPMTMDAVGHAAVRLFDGRVLVVGHNGASATLYDPATNQWSRADAPGAPRYAAPLVLVPSGKVLMAGGCGPAFSALDTTTLYDPVTGKWRDAGALHAKRCDHAAALLANGRVLAVGGIVPTDIELYDLVSTAELFDPVTETWRSTTAPGRQYASPSLALTDNGRAVVLGDVGDTEQFDPFTERWTLTGTRGGELGDSALATIPGGRLMAVGGNELRTALRYVGTAEIYDAYTGAWGPTASLVTARRQHTATTLADGRVLVTGGVGPSGALEATLTSTEVYQPVGPPAGLVAAIEYYNVSLDHYFVTASADDIDALDAGTRIPGWSRTGEQFPVGAHASTMLNAEYTFNGVAVCRFYLPPAYGDSHFFSASAQECAAVATRFPAFLRETDAAFYTALPNPLTGECGVMPGFIDGDLPLVPVYRLWNQRKDTNHRYTTRTDLRQRMIDTGWLPEGYGPLGVAMCVSPSGR